jgi:hypothetical protein
MKMNKEYTVSVSAANVYAFLISIPVVVFFILPYAWLYGWATMESDIGQFIDAPLLFILSIIFGSVIHELIHAICWSWLDGIPWTKIHFGFKWKWLTPYVHCPEPVEVSNYRWGVAMPGIVLGILPYLLALVLQNGWLLGFGLFFTIAAGGDILILWLLRSVGQGRYVQDHPELIGCKILESDNESKVVSNQNLETS